ncbi:aminopeptidase P family protein [Atopobacter sp. AH10]|uniref:M24 family metallopeptidase n=1 Tax=Atopobacter sp. AH10 TaxID=2315861 RepID=UPI000EF187C1|nr:aminopeptidase P family protein [Atopobacter sp. AH10]RLK62531.1 aminopeptidase P family protein [Atopobacter sp. AH10]
MNKRIQTIRESLIRNNLEALLITNPYNVRYVANFTGTSGFAVISKDKAFFVTDSRYTLQANEQAKGFEVITSKGNYYDSLAPYLIKSGIRELGFEADHLSYATYEAIAEILPVELVPTKGLILEIRRVKDEDEVAAIQEACRIADEAFHYILTYIKPGLTEIEVANALDFKMRELGASGVSFDTIVASGLRSAMPHGVASNKVIEEGDIITLDYGCYYKGYVSDVTRTFSYGELSDQLKEIHEVVRKAQEAGIKAIKPGVPASHIDDVARQYIKDKGYGEYYIHSTGHGIGLEIHEEPMVSSASLHVLKEGHVITCEPGIYIPGIGGVRIEDDILVTKDGHRVLTTTDRSLINISPKQ